MQLTVYGPWTAVGSAFAGDCKQQAKYADFCKILDFFFTLLSQLLIRLTWCCHSHFITATMTIREHL